MVEDDRKPSLQGLREPIDFQKWKKDRAATRPVEAENRDATLIHSPPLGGPVNRIRRVLEPGGVAKLFAAIVRSSSEGYPKSNIIDIRSRQIKKD